MKIEHFVFIVIGTYSDYGFALPAYNASAGTTYECRKHLIHHHYILHNFASHQGVHVIAVLHQSFKKISPSGRLQQPNIARAPNDSDHLRMKTESPHQKKEP